MRTLTYYQVDVFTNQPFHGFPVAVLTQSMGLSDAEMTQISAELNLAGTAFVLPSVEMARSHNRIRHFTLQGEQLWHELTTVAGLCVLASERKIPVPHDGSVYYRIEDNDESTFPVEIRCKAGCFERVFFSRPVPDIIEPSDECIDKALRAIDVQKKDIDSVIQPFATRDHSMCFIPLVNEKLPDMNILEGEKSIIHHQNRNTLFIPFSYRWTGKEYRIVQRFPLAPFNNRLDITVSNAACALIVGLIGQSRIIPTDREKGIISATVHNGCAPGQLSRYSIEAKALGSQVTALRLGGEAVVVMTGKIVMPD